jgi:hypothetical protein
MDEKSPTNSQVIRIGALVGFGGMLLPILYGIPWTIDMLDSPYRQNIIGWYSAIILFTLPGIPFGIWGAMIGSRWKKTRKAIWVGAVFGTILGIAGWFFIVSFIRMFFAQ